MTNHEDLMVERMAQKLFRTMMCAPYGNTTVGNIVCYEATYERLESTWIPLIITALSAPKQDEAEVGELISKERLLRGKVRSAAFGIATIEVDCSDFGQNTIGDGDEILILNTTKNPIRAKSKPAPQPVEAEGREAVAYVDPKSLINLKIHGHLGGVYGREWMWADPYPGYVPLYTTPQPEQPAIDLPPEIVNALPQDVRGYIMWLETDADPAGTIRENWRLTQENKALRALIAENPDIDLEQFRPAVECWRRQGVLGGDIPWSQVEEADCLLTIIDGAKQKKGI